MEITITPEDVTNVAPEFKNVEDETIEVYIDIARDFVCVSKWGEKKGKHAIILMTAHMMKDLGIGSNESSSASGPVTMEKVGDLQRSYASASLTGGSTSDQLLATTKYGRQFIMLRKTLVITPMVT